VKPLESAFQSVLAPWLRDFVLEKRAVGYRYDVEQRLLQRIDHLVVEHGHHEATLPRTVIEAWMARTAHETPATHVARISAVRQFARFLQRQGVLVEMPPTPPRSLRHTDFRARIFSPDEIARFFAALDQISPHVLAPHRDRVMPALFRVLYGCGLRLGEALHLRVSNVDLVAGVLTIHQGKFRKDRLVPMSPSLVAHLKRYHADMGERAADAVFFPAPHGGCYSHHAAYMTFRWMLRAAKIPHSGRGQGPRIHDFRHTFAVRRLEAWYREGVDVGAKLPVLSTYLGHESLAGTQRYLQLTVSLHPELSSALEQQYGALIPRGHCV
jgi:integrase/recombinase XerD